MAPLFFGCEPFEPIRFTITQSAKSEIGILVKYALGAIDPHLPKLYWASQAYTAYESQELQIVFGCSAVLLVLTAWFGIRSPISVPLCVFVFRVSTYVVPCTSHFCHH